MKIDLDRTYTTIYGESYKIIKYINHTNVIIAFTEYPEYQTSTCAVNIRNGNPYNPHRRILCGKGYHGVGIPISIDNKKTAEYIKWHGMIDRCYGNKLNEESKRCSKCYIDSKSEVSDDWLNYQNFAKWWKDNLNNSHGINDVLCLDSDLLNPEGNLYSSKTCSILPYSLNIGIQLGSSFHFDKQRSQYQVRVTRTITNESSHVGRTSNLTEAWYLYSKAKDKYISDSYMKLKLKLPSVVEHNLCNFNTLKRLEILGVIKV